MFYRAYYETPTLIGPAMLGRNKKRAVQVSFVKTGNDTPGEDKYLRPETVSAIADKTKEVAKYLAITAVVAYAAKVTIDTLSEIALKKTTSADNNEK